MMRLDGVGALEEGLEMMEMAMTSGDSWSIGTNVRYAPYQEFGTSYQSGTPHLRPGFDTVVNMKANQIISNHDDADVIVRKIAREIERQTKLKAPVDTGHLKNSYRSERF